MLVVERDPGVARAHELRCSQRLKVVVAQSIAEVRRVVDGGAGFDAALIGHRLPDGDGFAAVGIVQRLSPGVSVTMTSNDEPDADLINRCADTGISLLMIPFEEPEYRAIVGRALTASQLSDADARVTASWAGRFRWSAVERTLVELRVADVDRKTWPERVGCKDGPIRTHRERLLKKTRAGGLVVASVEDLAARVRREARRQARGGG